MMWQMVSLFLMIGGAFAALFVYRPARTSRWIGASSLFLSSLIGLIPVLQVLYTGKPLTLDLPWSLPMSSISLYLDRLSALFLLPLLALSALSAIYALGYTHGENESRKSAFSSFCLNFLVATMVLVLLAHNFIFFLVAWELMAIFSFFLVMEEDEKEEVRRAGWIYLIATHIGTAALIALFILIGTTCGSFDFNGTPPPTSSLLSGVFFLLAVIGFGAKAGFMPFHVWLPAAHASAPSYVSALMSGVMIKTAIYALIRFLLFMGAPPAWWGWSLIGIGAGSAILGALLALTQEDIKKLLAYSSIENMGIITLGLGVGLIGITHHLPLVALLGIGGAILHMINHALFKGLLFLGSGAIYHATHTRQMQRLGGLIKKMKGTTFAFLIGCLAISALPPFNGFTSEFLLFLASLTGANASFEGSSLFALLTIGSIAFIGGLSLTCFTRAFGILFLGQPRTIQAEKAEEVNLFMRVPLYILAASTLFVGLMGPFVVKTLLPLLSLELHLQEEVTLRALSFSQSALSSVIILSTFLLLFLTLLFTLRRHLLKHRQTEVRVTWDCGYVKPQEKMQYSASGFSEPLVSFFQWILRSKSSHRIKQDFFPSHASFSHTSNDFAEEWGYKPLFRAVRWSSHKLHWFQGGNLQLYILYIALTLFILLMWKT